MTRRRDLDVLRGFLLVMMTVTHLPTPFSHWITQPLGFVSAAEGFVFLSAFLAGMVYTKRARQNGTAAMRRAVLHRAVVIYVCQVVMLLFLFTVIATMGVRLNQPAITNLLSFYLRDPVTALWTGLALIYSPPLVDILPLYVVLMLVSPGVLTYALNRGWTAVIAMSIGAWALAQFDFGRWAYNMTLAVTGVPFRETGSFEMFAWQLLWVLGLWVGSREIVRPGSCPEFPRWLLGGAAVVALTGLIWRHAVGQLPFGSDAAALNLMFDKWHLAPLRLVNFFALLVLILHFGPRLRAAVRCSYLETLGGASLSVFCAHLVIVLLALMVAGDRASEMSWWAGAALIGASLSVLYVVARISHHVQVPSAAMPKGEEKIINAHAAR